MRIRISSDAKDDLVEGFGFTKNNELDLANTSAQVLLLILTR